MIDMGDNRIRLDARMKEELEAKAKADHTDITSLLSHAWAKFRDSISRDAGVAMPEEKQESTQEVPDGIPISPSKNEEKEKEEYKPPQQPEDESGTKILQKATREVVRSITRADEADETTRKVPRYTLEEMNTRNAILEWVRKKEKNIPTESGKSFHSYEKNAVVRSAKIDAGPAKEVVGLNKSAVVQQDDGGMFGGLLKGGGK